MHEHVCEHVYVHIVEVGEIRILALEGPAGAKVLRLKRTQGA